MVLSCRARSKLPRGRRAGAQVAERSCFLAPRGLCPASRNRSKQSTAVQWDERPLPIPAVGRTGPPSDCGQEKRHSKDLGPTHPVILSSGLMAAGILWWQSMCPSLDSPCSNLDWLPSSSSALLSSWGHLSLSSGASLALSPVLELLFLWYCPPLFTYCNDLHPAVTVREVRGKYILLRACVPENVYSTIMFDWHFRNRIPSWKSKFWRKMNTWLCCPLFLLLLLRSVRPLWFLIGYLWPDFSHSESL